MLLSVIDLIAFLCLAVQFVIAGYFLYLVYWSIELPPADGTVPALPDELPRVLVQIPVYNEPLVIDRVLGAAAALDWPRDRLVVQLLDDSTDITSDIAVHASDHRGVGRPSLFLIGIVAILVDELPLRVLAAVLRQLIFGYQ